MVGNDQPDDIVDVLLPALTDAVPGLDDQTAADTLISAMTALAATC